MLQPRRGPQRRIFDRGRYSQRPMIMRSSFDGQKRSEIVKVRGVRGCWFPKSRLSCVSWSQKRVTDEISFKWFLFNVLCLSGPQMNTFTVLWSILAAWLGGPQRDLRPLAPAEGGHGRQESQVALKVWPRSFEFLSGPNF